jgi:hypothetical protein
MSKKSKLVVVEDKGWSKLLCNGCYGSILSRRESASMDAKQT